MKEPYMNLSIKEINHLLFLCYCRNDNKFGNQIDKETEEFKLKIVNYGKNIGWVYDDFEENFKES